MIHLINAFAILQSQDAADELRAACKGVNAGRLETTIAGPQQLSDALNQPIVAEAILVELAPDNVRDCQALERFLREQARGRPVIAITRDTTVQTVRDLMRIGAADVVPRPIQGGDLAHALDNARKKIDSAGRRTGRAISFLRSCGGAGATTLAVQTALELVEHERGRKARVCLLDLDLQYGNAGLSLDLSGPSSLMQILEEPGRLDAAFLAATVSHHASGLDVLTAPPEIVPHDSLPVEVAARLVALAREQYDYVVLDLPHAWTAWTAPVLAASALAALVMRLDVTGVQRAQRHLKLIAEEELEDVPMLLVANQADQGSGWKQRQRDAEAVLGRRIDACVRQDARTAAAARESGRTLRDVAPSSVIVKDARALVDRMMAALNPAAVEAAGPAGSPVRRLLSFVPLMSVR